MLYDNPLPNWQLDNLAHIWMPYAQMKTAPLPVPVVRTSGVRIELADGRQLIDGLASWWSACHGYNHPTILAAMHRQLDQMPHVMFGGINHEPALRLAGRLAALLPGDLDHVFFADSGSVSVEVALKMAVQYWINRGQRGRTRFVAFHHGYHGDTTGAMAVCDPVNGMHAHFEGFLNKNYCVRLPASENELVGLHELILKNKAAIAAVIMEPLVQGAGGMRFHRPETLRRIRSICDDCDVLLIFDEIATGFGRTGSMFACQQAEVVPDIITLSKALSGGVIGLAAAIATRRVYGAFLSDDPVRGPAMALMHGPTYMANPLACAAANASLDLFETEDRLAQVAAIETQLKAELECLRGLPHVVDVRVKGAIGVIQVDTLCHNDWLKRQFIDRGVWLRPFGDAIYTTPALIISQSDLTAVTSAMVAVVQRWIERRVD